MNINTPLLRTTDVLILGGSSAAVEAALAVKAKGKDVFLATPFTYLGDDICAHMRYWPELTAETELARRILAGVSDTGECITPMRIKHGLEQALLEAGVEFLYGVHPVGVLRDGEDQPAGAVVANRSGFQAITAGVVIDATERALFGRQLPEASFTAWPQGKHELGRVIIGLEREAPANATRLPGHFVSEKEKLAAYRWHMEVDLPDASPWSVAKADVQSRLETWFGEQLASTDRPGINWPDRLCGTGRRQESWSGTDSFELAAMRCGAANVFLLSTMADVSDVVANSLREPAAAMALGRRLGSEVARLAKPPAEPFRVSDGGRSPVEGVDICRHDRYFRLEEAATLPMDLNRLPVLGEVDVLVAGGGTGGAPAAIAAARAGARTLVIESTSSLGGVGTEGRISCYWCGNRVGFTTEIDEGLQTLAPNSGFKPEQGRWKTEWKKQWYLKEAHGAGAHVWFGATVVAVAMHGGKACGAVVATPYGHGLVKAHAIVDSTGNADVAAAAGAETVNVSREHVAVQGSGLAPVNPTRQYFNTDFTFVDDTDVVDVTRTFAVARQKFRECFDLAQNLDTRQRQQICGEYSLDPVDFLAGRSYPDTITTAESNFDSHGFTIHPVFMAKAPDKKPIRAHIPYRCLLPRGVEGILVTGLGLSAHRDALPVVRMQPDVQNQGYAAGRAAAMSALESVGLREIDMPQLQQHLVETGVLERADTGRVDSFPLPVAEIGKAVREGIDDYLGLAVIFSNPQVSLPLLQQAYADENSPGRKLRYAHLLGLLGDGTGLETLVEELTGSEWDEGWHYKGMGQFGFSLSPVDSMLVAVGRIGDSRGLPVLMEKLESLGLGREFSHYRALVLAFEAMPSKQAAPVFEQMLEDVSGQARGDMASIVRESPDDRIDTSERNLQLKELMLARGLLACGDPHGKARAVLEAYRRDLHGHYSRHAQALLEGREISRKEMVG